MPIPKPKLNEMRKDYIKRLMGDDTMVNDYPDNKQRYAIAMSEYIRAKKKAGK